VSVALAVSGLTRAFGFGRWWARADGRMLVGSVDVLLVYGTPYRRRFLYANQVGTDRAPHTPRAGVARPISADLVAPVFFAFVLFLFLFPVILFFQFSFSFFFYNFLKMFRFEIFVQILKYVQFLKKIKS
jgi:hypothetical protein